MHIPVLVKEIIKILNPKSNQNYIDATFGFGGHSIEILKRTGPNGKILAIEWDPIVLDLAKKEIMKKYPKFKKRIIFRNENYKEIKKIIKEENFYEFSGIIFDLGVSSWHLEKSRRGFSYLKDEELDMRFNPKIEITARDIVNFLDKNSLEEFLKTFEEKDAKKLAELIVKKRKEKKIETTKDLVEITRFKKSSKKHPARLLFQALRMLVNDEISNIYEGIKDAIEISPKGAKIIILTYQGLENKIVKKIIKEYRSKIKVIEKLKPTKEEIKKNPRARSAKLIALEKTNDDQI
jgi:16S rRNA (cytosine1402-N4)-methyltransferase